MSAQIELRLQGAFDHLSPILEAGRAVLETIPNLHACEDLCHQIQVAIQEMVTNVLRHGYEGEEGEVRVALAVDGYEFICEIRDRARAFDPLTHVYEQAVDGSMPDRAGGFGIHIATIVMTSVEYRREDGENVLTLTKLFDPVDLGIPMVDEDGHEDEVDCDRDHEHDEELEDEPGSDHADCSRGALDRRSIRGGRS